MPLKQHTHQYFKRDDWRGEKMKFRKKPGVIDAVQLLWQNWSEICDFLPVGKMIDGKAEGCWIGQDGQPIPDQNKPDCTKDRLGIYMPTLEGVMMGIEKDWIIKGVKGEFYPCKPDIFETTYEKMEMRIQSICLDFPLSDNGEVLFYRVGSPVRYNEDKRIVNEIRKATKLCEFCEVAYYEIYAGEQLVAEMHQYGHIQYFKEDSRLDNITTLGNMAGL
jgi:hypothetical protein